MHKKGGQNYFDILTNSLGAIHKLERMMLGDGNIVTLKTNKGPSDFREMGKAVTFLWLPAKTEMRSGQVGRKWQNTQNAYEFMSTNFYLRKGNPSRRTFYHTGKRNSVPIE